MEWWCRMKLRFVRWKRMKIKIKLENLEIAFLCLFCCCCFFFFFPVWLVKMKSIKMQVIKKCSIFEYKKNLWGNFCSFFSFEKCSIKIVSIYPRTKCTQVFLIITFCLNRFQHKFIQINYCRVLLFNLFSCYNTFCLQG